jgi:hypothetical protein
LSSATAVTPIVGARDGADDSEDSDFDDEYARKKLLLWDDGWQTTASIVPA